MHYLPQQVLLALIRVYQYSVSPNHSWVNRWYPYGFCRFYPSCSQYAADSISKYGVGRGLLLAAQRLLRCHPWHRGGFDLVK